MLSSLLTLIGIFCNTAQTCFTNSFLFFLDRLNKEFSVWGFRKEWPELIKSIKCIDRPRWQPGSFLQPLWNIYLAIVWKLVMEPLEKEMAAHSSVLAWRVLWTGEPGGMPSIMLHRVRHGWSDLECMRTLEKEMATHSSALVWKIPWVEEPGSLQSVGSQRAGHDWATSLKLFTFMHWRRKWQPTPVFLPESPVDRGAW